MYMYRCRTLVRCEGEGLNEDERQWHQSELRVGIGDSVGLYSKVTQGTDVFILSV